jgi:limonene 1,2-monooxygenase
MFRAHEWANREQTMRSYELFARYVMPRFQGTLPTLFASNEFVRNNTQKVVGGNVEAIQRAFTDVGHAIPQGYEARVIGFQEGTKRD